MPASRLRRNLGILAGLLPAAAALALFIALPAQAAGGARGGLALCAGVIVPSLLPFFVASALLGELGLPQYLGRLLAPFMSRLFGVTGAGAAAFILGISGGYPLGAATVAELYRRGECAKEEAERLLAFCNNSGPAFIIGVAGAGVFGSSGVGLKLYATHIAAALITGALLGIKAPRRGARRGNIEIKALRFPEALSAAVKNSVTSTLAICGFVTFFSVIIGILDGAGIFTSLAGALHEVAGISYGAARALLGGILELGTGIGSLAGLGAYPGTIALAAFILSWGGVSVHFQTLSMTSGTGLSLRLHTAGRLLCGLIAAALAYALV